ncbi:MAG: VOC family protein [Chloroflexota bacterium]|nr:VOC family protein [Chloroflexota bacterium]
MPDYPPLFRKVDCIRMPVADLEGGLAFYRDALGHQLNWRTATAAGLRMPDSDAEIVIHTEGHLSEVDLLVDSVEQAANRFTEAGGRIVSGPFDIAIGRCAVVADRWGNVLVILDMSKGRLTVDAKGNVIGNQPPPQPPRPERS